jgi:hypothetical protein
MTRGTNWEVQVSTRKMRSSQMKAVEVPNDGKKTTPSAMTSEPPRKKKDASSTESLRRRSSGAAVMVGLLGAWVSGRAGALAGIIPRRGR